MIRAINPFLRTLAVLVALLPAVTLADMTGQASVIDGATIEAAMRANEFLDQSNLDGQRVWMRIMGAIEELQRERPGDGEAVH